MYWIVKHESGHLATNGRNQVLFYSEDEANKVLDDFSPDFKEEFKIIKLVEEIPTNG